jgi:hypothetical protein
MNTTPEALKQLYEALGGDSANVSDVSTNVEALKFIYIQLGGEEDVSEISTIPDMIEAIAALNIAKPSGTKTITENGTYDVAAFETAEVNVPSAVPQSPKYTIINNTSQNINFRNSVGILEDKIVANTVTINAGESGDVFGLYMVAGTGRYPTMLFRCDISGASGHTYTLTGQNNTHVTVYHNAINDNGVQEIIFHANTTELNPTVTITGT